MKKKEVDYEEVCIRIKKILDNHNGWNDEADNTLFKVTSIIEKLPFSENKKILFGLKDNEDD